jgi:hypothetical protein
LEVEVRKKGEDEGNCITTACFEPPQIITIIIVSVSVIVMG